MPRQVNAPAYVHKATVLGHGLPKVVADALPKHCKVWVGLYKRQPATFIEYTGAEDFRDKLMRALGAHGLESMVVRVQYEDKVR